LLDIFNLKILSPDDFKYTFNYYDLLKRFKNREIVEKEEKIKKDNEDLIKTRKFLNLNLI